MAGSHRRRLDRGRRPWRNRFATERDRQLAGLAAHALLVEALARVTAGAGRAPAMSTCSMSTGQDLVGSSPMRSRTTRSGATTEDIVGGWLRHVSVLGRARFGRAPRLPTGFRPQSDPQATSRWSSRRLAGSR